VLNTPFSPWPSFSETEAELAKNILLSNKVNYWTGKECREFETEFAHFTGSKYAIALANGTLALDLAMVALNIGKGDEVIVTSRTFLASVSSIVNCGATPVFADVSPDTQNITEASINSVLTNKTKAIICVHLAGWPCDMDEIMLLSKQKNLVVIEDCAQAHGAQYKGKSGGSIGDVGCWSFCQDKIMTTGGEGGMVTTDNEQLWKKMWAYKDHGKSYDAIYNKQHAPGFRWLHESFGTNWRMTEIQGAIGRYQLKKMPEWTALRNQNQNRIWQVCSELRGLRVPNLRCASCLICDGNNKCTHAAYKAYVFIKANELNEGWTRDKIIDAINEEGVPCYSGSCSEVYLEKAFDNTTFRPDKRLSMAKQLGESSLMFLIHPTLSDSEIDLTCITIKKVMFQAAAQ